MGVKAYQQNKNPSAYYPLFKKKTNLSLGNFLQSQPSSFLEIPTLPRYTASPAVCLSLP